MKTISSIAITAALALSTSAALATVFTTNATINIGDTTYDGQDVVVSNCTLTVNGSHSFTSLLVTSNGVITHAADPAGTIGNRLDLTILTDATVALGGAIHADGQGYGAQQGPGAGGTLSCDWNAGGGGGHGGLGGAGNDGCGLVPGGAAYGSVLQPVTFGSGGGWAGGAGGGAICLNVGGTLTVEGQISANGLSAAWGYGGGGAGGSVWLTVGTLSGTGVISANGGPSVAAYGGGGAGGRIAIYQTNNFFTGTFSARGGTGGENGGAGTIYTKAASLNTGNLLVDNGGTNGAMTLLTSPVAFNVTITNAAVVYFAAPVLFNNLNVAAGGSVTHLPTLLGVQITCLGNLTIQAGGVIQADGLGYGAQQGPGAGGTDHCNWYAGGGGGHGGSGGVGDTGCGQFELAAGGAAYGSVLQPVTFGSGGGWAGGAGGGAICLNVGGTLTVEGQISANGLSAAWGYGGGGAGGSVWLTVGTLSGTGVISANGGPSVAAYGGGGAGGRIAIYTYSTAGFDTNHISAAGAGAAGLGSLVFGYPPPCPNAEVVGSALRLAWRAGAGGCYQVWSSPDLVNWSLYGPVRTGTGDILTQDCPMTNSPGLFFRVQLGN